MKTPINHLTGDPLKPVEAYDLRRGDLFTIELKDTHAASPIDPGVCEFTDFDRAKNVVRYVCERFPSGTATADVSRCHFYRAPSGLFAATAAAPAAPKPRTFVGDLTEAMNYHGADSASNTPDTILGHFYENLHALVGIFLKERDASKKPASLTVEVDTTEAMAALEKITAAATKARSAVQAALGATAKPEPVIVNTGIPGPGDNILPLSQSELLKALADVVCGARSEELETALRNLRHWREECGKLHARLKILETPPPSREPTREEIATARLMGEVRHQEKRHGFHAHSVAEWVGLIEHWTRKADKAWIKFDDTTAMEEIRCIAALAFSAMVQHETPARKNDV